MICDNCGAIVDRKEEYCPNCGMQLSNMRPKPAKKKKHYKRSKSYNESRSADKPIKKKYIEKSKPESYNYSQYRDDDQYISPNQNYYEGDYKRKSGIGIGGIIIFLLIALALGFTVGLIMFTSELIPKIPGLNI